MHIDDIRLGDSMPRNQSIDARSRDRSGNSRRQRDHLGKTSFSVTRRISGEGLASHRYGNGNSSSLTHSRYSFLLFFFYAENTGGTVTVNVTSAVRRPVPVTGPAVTPVTAELEYVSLDPSP